MQTNTDKLPISVLLVGCNEAHFLPRCLESVSFCDDINYFDLESTDNSIQIAEQFGAKITRHKKVPIAEFIREEHFRKLKHNWLLVMDPDEVLDPELIADVRKAFVAGIPDNIAGIRCPWIFYFKKHRLVGTPWGGGRYKTFFVHCDRCILTSQVNNGRIILDGFEDMTIPLKENNIVHYYWMNSYRNLFDKHWRYLKLEPKVRYDLGKRTRLKYVLKMPISSFRYAFFTRQGYKDKFMGLFLSLIWMWYESFVEIGLYRYQKKQNKK